MTREVDLHRSFIPDGSSKLSRLMITTTKMASDHGVQVHWLGQKQHRYSGTTFGIPWPRSRYQPATTGFLTTNSAPIQSWITAYWPDGSIKWSAHAVAALDERGSSGANDGYTVKAVARTVGVEGQDEAENSSSPLVVSSNDESVTVRTGKMEVVMAKRGQSIIQSITNARGDIVGQNGRLVLLSQSHAPDDDAVSLETDDKLVRYESVSEIREVEAEQSGPVRAVIRAKGLHAQVRSGSSSSKNEELRSHHTPWLPFTLRFYFFANSEAVRITHTITYDGDANCDFVRGIGFRLDVPLENGGASHLYDRHVRFTSADGGVLRESVQGVTGLWRDPGARVRQAQVEGKPLPPQSTWSPEFAANTLSNDSLKWVPSWDDYSLTQLTPDGFSLRKRTKVGQSWVKVASESRAGGVAYLGEANRGGLALGLRYFWERYPTGVDLRGCGQKTGEATVWLYSPAAEPMDMRQYHDGLGQETFDDQLDALKVTYEDWEPGMGRPYGIARTNEVFLLATDRTPSAESLAQFTGFVRDPPVLVPDLAHVHSTGALGGYWPPPSQSANVHDNPARTKIEDNLDFLFTFYKNQIAQRKWYGFWDHGDIMHTYDEDRHAWRYDVGGYAWDNSELSPDLWLWLYFLHTGREDVYRTAEALTRHTGEVDVYHLGGYKGLGTRHGVQHWSDSCKQGRISNALYRRYFYFLSGADERTGELLEETLETERTFVTLDPYRKVRKDRGSYQPDPRAVNLSLGTDWGALAAAWFVELERRGPRWEEAQAKLLRSVGGIGRLANGFVTGRALYDTASGEVSRPVSDPENKGVVQVSHLNAMFGLAEICAEVIGAFPSETAGFKRAWLEYCRYFNASEDEQRARFGQGFGKLQLRQGHSRLTAYAARVLGDAGLARRAWGEFYLADGYGPDLPWRSEVVEAPQVLGTVDEAKWASTNITALYGLAAIQNLAYAGEHLEEVTLD